MLLDSPIDAAGIRARIRHRPQVVAPNGSIYDYDYEGDTANGESLYELITDSEDGWTIVYPTGAVIPIHAVNTIWLTPGRPFFGSGVQMAEACRRLRISPEDVFPAPEWRMSGTALFCWTEDDARDWRFVQPATLPAFAGL